MITVWNRYIDCKDWQEKNKDFCNNYSRQLDVQKIVCQINAIICASQFFMICSKKRKAEELILAGFAPLFFEPYFNDKVSVRPITSIDSLSSLSNQPIARWMSFLLTPVSLVILVTLAEPFLSRYAQILPAASPIIVLCIVDHLYELLIKEN
jgi:hypothetical protein